MFSLESQFLVFLRVAVLHRFCCIKFLSANFEILVLRGDKSCANSSFCLN